MMSLSLAIVTFLIVADRLGSERYGVFSGTVALMMFISPFSSMGAGYHALSRLVAKGDPLALGASRAWGTVVLGAMLFGAAVLGARRLVLPQAPLVVLACIVVSELVGQQLTQANRFIGQALQKLWLNAVATATLGGARLASAVLYLDLSPRPTLAGWALCYAATSVAGALAGVLVIARTQHVRIGLTRPDRRAVREGITYSLTGGSINAKDDADKWLLLRFGEAHASGVYAAGYRIIGAAYAPTVALAEATFARFFQVAAGPPQNSRRLAVRVTLAATMLNLAVSAFVVGAAPLIVTVLGGEYRDTVSVIRWLALMPLLLSWQVFAGNALTGRGLQRVRLRQTGMSAALNIVLNVVLIPAWSWRGAAAATIATELFLACSHWMTLIRLRTTVAA